jgi:hypothetical protein
VQSETHGTVSMGFGGRHGSDGSDAERAHMLGASNLSHEVA